jgi:carboxyl-terminal processing protease
MIWTRFLLHGVLALALLGLAGAAPAAASTEEVDEIISANVSRTGIELRDEEHQLLRKALAILDERYLTQTPAKDIVGHVFKALQERENKPEEEASKAKTVSDSEDPLDRMDEALNLALRELDAHTAYLSPNAFREMRVRTRGEFGGLGLEVTMEDSLVKVVTPIDDTPAERAGMQAGDLISEVDGTPVKGMSLRQAVMRMRGRVGTEIVLTVLRKGVADPIKVTIVRDVIRIRAVRYRREGDIGYIRLTTFSEKAESGIHQAVEAFRTDGKGPVHGYVLDLRNNPGGLLDQAIRVADAFLDDGNIVSVKGRIASDNASYDAEYGDVLRGQNVVVLVNAGSASASEIVAGALQDNHRATVIGHRSFGKGSVQTIMPMGRFGALRLTTALYYTPSGRAIQARGVIPDLQIRLKEEPEADKVRREENLEHALANPNNRNQNAAAPVVEAQRCQDLLEKKVEDDGLACALAVLRLGGIARVASAAAGE